MTENVATNDVKKFDGRLTTGIIPTLAWVKWTTGTPWRIIHAPGKITTEHLPNTNLFGLHTVGFLGGVKYTNVTVFWWLISRTVHLHCKWLENVLSSRHNTADSRKFCSNCSVYANDGHPPLTYSSDTRNFGVRLPFWKLQVTHEHAYVSPAQRI